MADWLPGLILAVEFCYDGWINTRNREKWLFVALFVRT
jgi:hypothetical protein